ncbi:NAD(P)/FAD-dependent oxidoreductase [Nocardioides coralli]|nr:NAD(P)/FAD-dependent oxidoreductase [Nocardioides coralli]
MIVIGLGPGGEHVAGSLADAGLSVLGVDHGLVGGECPYWGCVPSKMMIRAADALAEARRVPGLGGDTGAVRPDWTTVATRIREEATDRWDDSVAVQRFEDKGGTFVRGTGRVVGQGRVEVDGVTYSAGRGVVLATGTQPAVPPIEGLEDVPYWTNHEAIEAKELPESLVVLGGGAIGCELAQVFARFGVAVTVVEMAPHLVAGDEPEVGEALAEVFAEEGIRVLTGAEVQRAGRDGDQVVLTTADGTVTAERLLVATGRRVDLAGLGVAALGLDDQAGSLPVDGRCRVTDGVWGVGDVTGEGAFTHVAMYQAEIVIADLLGRDHPEADYRGLPRVTFTDPEVGAVGMTEQQARDAGITVRTGSAQVPSTARGWIHKAGNEGLIKLVEDTERGVLVGATAMSPAGGEVLGALAVAVSAQVPTAALRSMIYAYPTFHRGIEDALRDLG